MNVNLSKPNKPRKPRPNISQILRGSPKFLASDSQKWPANGKRVALVLVSLLLAVLAPWILLTANHNLFWLSIILSCGVSLVALSRSSSLGWGSLGVILTLTTLTFHLGLVPYLWLGLSDTYGFISYVEAWLSSELARQAVGYVTSMTAAGAVGYFAASRVRRRGVTSRKRYQLNGRPRSVLDLTTAVKRRILGAYGLVLTVFGAVLVFRYYRLFEGYEVFLAESNASLGSWGPFLIMAGWAISISSGRRMWTWLAGFVAVVAFLAMAASGSRIYLGLGALVAVIAAVKSRDIWLRGWTVAVGVLGLAMSAVFRSLRDAIWGIPLTANPLNGLFELGGSIRPLVEIMRLHSNGQFSRTHDFTNSLFVWPIHKFQTDLGLPVTVGDIYGHGVQVLAEEFGDGYFFAFSNMAELYVNFSNPVALIVAMISGAALRWVDGSGKGSPIGGLVSLSFAVPLLYAVRQPGTLVTAHFLLMATLACGALLATWIMGTLRHNCSAEARQQRHRTQS